MQFLFSHAIFFLFCKSSPVEHHTNITNQHLPYTYLYKRSSCSWKKYWSTHFWLEIACIQVVHDIADKILNHTYIYIVESFKLGKRSSHMHVEVWDDYHCIETAKKGYVNHNDTTHVLDRYIVQLTNKQKTLLHVLSSMIHKLYYLGLCRFKSFILFILLDHAFSIRISFSRTNTFEIHSISTSKYLIHLITDDIKNYCIFGTKVPLLNVKPNWEKVIYLSFNSFIHLFLACYLC
jgi:hypothetical protein